MKREGVRVVEKKSIPHADYAEKKDNR